MRIVARCFFVLSRCGMAIMHKCFELLMIQVVGNQ